MTLMDTNSDLGGNYVDSSRYLLEDWVRRTNGLSIDSPITPVENPAFLGGKNLRSEDEGMVRDLLCI